MTFNKYLPTWFTCQISLISHFLSQILCIFWQSEVCIVLLIYRWNNSSWIPQRGIERNNIRSLKIKFSEDIVYCDIKPIIILLLLTNSSWSGKLMTEINISNIKLKINKTQNKTQTQHNENTVIVLF